MIGVRCLLPGCQYIQYQAYLLPSFQECLQDCLQTSSVKLWFITHNIVVYWGRTHPGLFSLKGDCFWEFSRIWKSTLKVWKNNNVYIMVNREQESWWTMANPNPSSVIIFNWGVWVIRPTAQVAIKVSNSNKSVTSRTLTSWSHWLYIKPENNAISDLLWLQVSRSSLLVHCGLAWRNQRDLYKLFQVQTRLQPRIQHSRSGDKHLSEMFHFNQWVVGIAKLAPGRFKPRSSAQTLSRLRSLTNILYIIRRLFTQETLNM